MKFIVLSLIFCIFQTFVWAETPLNKKTGIIHIEHVDHIPHQPTGKDPTEKVNHDGIMYPRKRAIKGLFETA